MAFWCIRCQLHTVVRLLSDPLFSPCLLQPWYMHPLLVVIFSGILPFGAVSVELFFIMSALWLHQFYYIFGQSLTHSDPHHHYQPNTQRAYEASVRHSVS